MPVLIPFIQVAFQIAVIASFAISVIQAFSPSKPAKISFGFQGDTGGSPRYGLFGPLDNTVSNELAVPVLYGRLKIAGNVIWQSEPGQQISKIIGLCEGEIACIGDVRANDLSIEDGVSAPGCTVTKYLGTLTQRTDSRVPATTNEGIALAPNMELHNLAYIAITLVASEQLNGGNPTITSVSFGKLVEIWNGVTWTTTKYFSRNPAAIIRDLLINERYGLGIPRENIDDDSFGIVYNHCKELIGA